MKFSLSGAGPKGLSIIQRDQASLSPSYTREYALVVDHAQGSELWDVDGRRAGFVRNEEMAQVADGLVAFWDGASPGTGHMIATMQALGKRVVRVAYGATGVAGDRSRLGRGRNVRHVDEKPKGRP